MTLDRESQRFEPGIQIIELIKILFFQQVMQSMDMHKSLCAFSRLCKINPYRNML
jgi:hypothetical protein